MAQHISCKRVYGWNVEQLNTLFKETIYNIFRGRGAKIGLKDISVLASSEGCKVGWTKTQCYRGVRWHLPRNSHWDICLAQAKQCEWNKVTKRGHLVPQGANECVQKFTTLCQATVTAEDLNKAE